MKAIPGARWAELRKKALLFYREIEQKTKRRAYIRSTYFNKQKIFLGLFWSHLYEKQNLKDKTRRIKYFPCAIELIQNSRFKPLTVENPNKKSEIFYRFYGCTPNNGRFCVQIKGDKNSGEKWFISVFPLNI